MPAGVDEAISQWAAGMLMALIPGEFAQPIQHAGAIIAANTGYLTKWDN